jgi:hypothetical protein
MPSLLTNMETMPEKVAKQDRRVIGLRFEDQEESNQLNATEEHSLNYEK